MKVKLLTSVVLAIGFLSSFLISKNREIDKSVVTMNKEEFQNYLNANYKIGKYGTLTGVIIQKGECIIFKKLPRLDSPQPVESITKSVASLVIGIALKHGDIKDINERIFRFFPEYTNKNETGWRFITLGDLLTMRSGIEWNEDKRPERLNPTYQMYSAKNMYEYIFAQKLNDNNQFNYSSANAALLSQIIFKSTGKLFAEYADEFLFKPLGIHNYKWNSYKNGTTNTSGGLYLTLDDLTKLGQLYLQNGIWNGKEIVDAKWINDSFKSYSEVKGYIDANSYGYMWWINDFYEITKTGKHVKICSACGFNNNHILVVPELDLLLVTMGDSSIQVEKYLSLLDDILAQLSE